MRSTSTATHSVSDGTTLRLIGWPAPVSSDLVVVVHHGLGEHGGRYASLANGLGDAPIHVWSYDARGHGETSGKRGHADGLDAYARDLHALIPVLLERAGATRAIVYGHSMGAAAVGRYLTRYTPHESIVGAWFSGAALKVDTSGLEMRIKAAAAPLLSAIAPRLTLANALDVNGISSVPEEVRRYQEDPLVHDRLSARLGASILADAEVILAEAHRITVPTRMWHGSDDTITQPAGTRAFHEAVGSTDKTFELVHGARHEVHHETPAITELLFGSLRSWVAERFQPA